MCIRKQITLWAQDMITILDLTVNIIWKTYIDHIMNIEYAL